MNEIAVKVFAKLNLGLNVLQRNEVGYHKLDTVMTSVNMYDVVQVTKRTDDQINVTFYRDGAKVFYPDNTVMRAANGFFGAFCKSGFDVIVNKGIWEQAGLGGSSADIAGVLYCLCRLYEVPVINVLPLALSIGTDSVFMLKGGLARVYGVGESIQSLPYKQLYFFAARAKGGVATSRAYDYYDEYGGENGDIEELIAALAEPEDSFFLRNVSRHCFNALAPSASILNPNIPHTERFMREVAGRPTMTGSGSALFSLIDGTQSSIAAITTGISTYENYSASHYDKHCFLASVPSAIELIRAV